MDCPMHSWGITLNHRDWMTDIGELHSMHTEQVYFRPPDNLLSKQRSRPSQHALQVFRHTVSLANNSSEFRFSA